MILHVITGLNVGGAEKALLRLLISYDDADCLIISLTSKGLVSEELEQKGFQVIALGLNGFNFLFVFFRLIKLIFTYKPIVVQTWLYHADFIGGLAAKLVGVKHVVWGVRTTELRKGSYATIAIRKLLAWLSYFIPTRIIVVAERAKSKHIEIGYDASKMVVIPNGFDLGGGQVSARDLALLKQDIGLTKDDLVIGCVGRFSQDKAQDVFIQAAALVLEKFPHVKFLLVGRGLELTNNLVMDWISMTALPQNFVLLGERSDVSTCLKVMDVFCLPSRTEGFPNVLGEAMLAGVPCVATNAGDAAVLGGRNVPIAKVDDPVDLAEKLIRMLDLTQGERDEIGQKLHQRIVNEYSIERMVSRYADLYKELKGDRK